MRRPLSVRVSPRFVFILAVCLHPTSFIVCLRLLLQARFDEEMDGLRKTISAMKTAAAEAEDEMRTVKVSST